MSRIHGTDDTPAPVAHYRTDQPGSGQPAPICERCSDVGYYLLDVPIDDPNFGVLQLCGCLGQQKEQRRFHTLQRLSNLDAFRDKTFRTFDASVAGVETAYERARAFARAPHKRWLVFFGNYGCGKTHLAAAIANDLLRRNHQVIFSVVPDLLDHLRSTFAPSSEVVYDQMFQEVRETPFLVLDDLGTENTTPWAREKLYQIINHRYNYRLSTVITSNRKPEDIEPRIYSRMLDKTLHEGIIMIDSADYRLLRPEQRRRRKPS